MAGASRLAGPLKQGHATDEEEDLFPRPHPWGVRTAAEARALQRRLARQVRFAPLDPHRVRWVGGADVSAREERLRAAIVVWDCATHRVVHAAVAEGPAPMPYRPGFLSFREVPLLQEAWQRLAQHPTVLLVDGHGIAHPLGLGIAAHFGVLLDWPTIGVAKRRLIGRLTHPLPAERGARVPLVWRNRVIGMAVRTRRGVKPVWVSPGHRITLDAAVELVLRCSHYRLPEPLRAAHRLAGQWEASSPSAERSERAD